MLIDLLRSYAEGETDLDAVVGYARTIPPRERPEAGSPDWFDGPISEWDDLSRGLMLGYVTPDEAKVIAGKGKRCRMCGISHRHGNKGGCPCPTAPGRSGPCACEGAGEPTATAEGGTATETASESFAKPLEDKTNPGDKPRPNALDLGTRNRVAAHLKSIGHSLEELYPLGGSETIPGAPAGPDTDAKRRDLIEKIQIATGHAQREVGKIKSSLGIGLHVQRPPQGVETPYRGLPLPRGLDSAQQEVVIDAVRAARELAILQRVGVQPAGTLQWMSARGYEIAVEYDLPDFVLGGMTMKRGGEHNYNSRRIGIAAEAFDRAWKYGGNPTELLGYPREVLDHEVGHASVRMLLERTADAESEIYYGDKPDERRGLANGTEPRYKYHETMRGALDDLSKATLDGEHATDYVKAWANDERGRYSDIAGVTASQGERTRASISRAANENFAEMSAAFARHVDDEERLRGAGFRPTSYPKAREQFLTEAKRRGYAKAARAFLKLYREASTRRRRVVPIETLESGTGVM